MNGLGWKIKDEYLLPNVADALLKDGIANKEDKQAVVASFRKLIQDGVYKRELYKEL